MIEYAIYSDVGNRQINEDYVGNSEKPGKHIFSLADGLGGHGKGEVASEMGVKTSLELFDKCEDVKTLLRDVFVKAQENILEAQKTNSELFDMKTTMVCLFFSENNRVQWGHIGDSRLYCFNLKKRKLLSRTKDHSVPQMLVNLGEIKEKEIRYHEDRNRLLRVLGMPWTNKAYEIEVSKTIKNDAAFLLCSDGFWELIEEKEMVRCLKKAENVQEWLDLMKEIVQKNGEKINMDNNSAIAVWVTDIKA